MGNDLILNRLFTIASFNKLIEQSSLGVYSAILKRYIDTTKIKTNAEAITDIYMYLRKQYRNQYYYKNTILNKLLLGVHSINTTTALAEIPISTSKADFVLINGKAVVYEIKTELDNLERLNGQLENYYKAFDHVCVVTCTDYASELKEKLADSDVGLYVLTPNETIKRIKEPKKCCEYLNLGDMFKVLNKPEYETIIREYYGSLPNVSQVKHFSKCKELFENIPMDKAYLMFLRQLKLRNEISSIQSFQDVPYELKSIAYFSQYRDSDYSSLQNFLSSEIGGNI